VHTERTRLIKCETCDFIPGVTPLTEVRGAQHETVTAVQAPLELSSIPGAISYRGELPPRARSLYYDALAAERRGEPALALRLFTSALEFVPEFTDAHLALARLSDDPAVQKEHLDAALAYDPGNAELIRQWMLLKGQLTPEAAARAARGAAPEIRHSDGAVKTQTAALICPVCSGHLTVDEETHQVMCRFCGHHEALQTGREVGLQSLAMALITRKAEPVRWVIGERLLHCNRCGAERTLPATVLSMECPFCGSTQVIEQDAVKSFIQPDGLVPFQISEREVITHIKDALDSPLEKLAGFFDDNRVKSGIIDGVYLPFWLFDVVVDISRTRTTMKMDYGQGKFPIFTPLEERFTDAEFNLPIIGSKTLAEGLAANILDFDYSRSLPFEAKLLAKYPASLYDIDFDQASLRARGQVAEAMRDKHRPLADEEQARVSAHVTNMSFSLLLLPFFMVKLKERDGDERPALVNGQTGSVAFGKTRKRGR
jgi:Zn finger protein HypA/HybF involved in hydrogenase expression